jgi:hypothetical protein
MDRSEVAARWPVITICTSIGSAVNDMIATWIELWCVDGGEPKGWRDRVAQHTLIEEAGEVAERGPQ